MNRPVPPQVMRELRHSFRRYSGYRLSQARAASKLKISRGTVATWESQGGFVADGYAYLGLAWQLGGQALAMVIATQLFQLEAFEGGQVTLFEERAREWRGETPSTIRPRINGAALVAYAAGDDEALHNVHPTQRTLSLAAAAALAEEP